jgi:GAF domain-containing protein
MNYQLLLKQFEALLIGRELTDFANTSAFLNEVMVNINWVGFYLLEGETLFLGPFQGKTACTIIPITKGVCGASARSRQILNVADVHQFEGHIACDSASRSEVVFPLIKNDVLIGVLDIDSPLLNRFSDPIELEFLESLVAILMKH